MAFSTLNAAFKFNFKEVIVEEIALEGLEGIGIDLLWRRIEYRISSPLTEKMEIRFWNYIMSCKSISLYQNPAPLHHLELVDRFTLVVPETGDLKEPDDYLEGPYEYSPIEKENGSCQYYKTRTLLDKDMFAQITYKEVLKTYGDTLVMVASKEERWHALAPHMPYSCASELSTVHYCILELVGKSRENGQLTIGKTNLNKINKDPKLLFYNRKTLQDLDLIRVTYVTQVTTGRGAVKGILLRLKKFHKSFIGTVPKVGPIHNLVSYLKEQPNYCEKTEVVLKRGLLTQKQNKRFQKKFYIFGFEEKPINNEELVTTKNRLKPHSRRRYIYLLSKSDESSNSEEEDAPTPLRCQYKVGVTILRQSYERFLEAGLKGLTQIELSEIVGIEFYISRTICRIFKSKNLVREFLEDKGRQRTARYIAVAATAKMDVEYAEALKTFENFLNETHSLKTKISNDGESDTEHVPSKKIKLETESQDINGPEESDITELNSIEGIPKVSAKSFTGSNKKTLSLRQLRFANGLLKLIREKKFVAGYQSLSRQIGIEIGEPPMDNKALKIFLQKLLMDGQIRVIRIKWPGFQTKCSTLICAPNITPSNPIIKAKYKEIVKRAARNKEIYKKVTSGARPLALYAYPRYIKIQKLHEAIMNFVYFENVKSEPDDNVGYVYIKDLMPELTVQVALGLISSTGAIDLKKFALCDALLDVKLRDAPAELSKVLIKSVNLYNSVRSILKALALFGLVQLIALTPPQTTKAIDQNLGIHLIYANRHARILDTSGVWPKQNINMRHIEKEFYFRTFEDVADYWSTVYNVSTNTTIDLPGRSNNKSPKAPVRTTHEVFDCDNGQIYGDGLGACGFDSSFYIDMPRLWRAYCTRPSKPKKQPVKIPKLERVRKRQVVKKKRHVFEEPEKPPVVKPSTSKQTTIQNKQATRKRAPSPLLMRAQKKSFESQLWTAEEDRVLLLCKVALNIMSPSTQPGCVQLRNLIAKDILALKDPRKTQKVCHRRAMSLETCAAHTREKDCLLTELKRRYSIIKNYEGMLKKLRILNYSNMAKYINEARLPLMELVWIAYQVHKTKSFTQITPNFKINPEDFHKKYTVLTMAVHRPGNMYKTPHDDINIGTLKEAIALTVMLSYKKDLGKENAAKIYHFFARYDENVLRQAVEQLRKSGSIVAKEKIFNVQMHKANLDDIVQCCYRISAVYQRKWSYRLIYLDHLANCVNMNSIENNLKSTPPINCFAFEQNATGVLEINVISLPVVSGFSGTLIQEDQLNAIDIETKYKLKSSTVGWKKCSSVSTFSELYKDINYDELQCLRRSVVSNEVLFKTNAKNEASEMEDKILVHLSSKREKGARFHELKALCGCDTKTLMETLTQLENEQFLKRVGFYENVVVLTEHFKAWAFLIGDLYILPSPWFNVDGSIREDIFFNWATMLINKIFDSPGCSVSSLADSCEFLSCRSVQDICDIMKSYGCVILRTMIRKEVSLFSDEDDVPLEFESYNPYESPDNIFVFPVKDSLSKYATVRKHMLNKNS